MFYVQKVIEIFILFGLITKLTIISSVEKTEIKE